jgi:TonB-linked SusC/RagA family outer membrane protein
MKIKILLSLVFLLLKCLVFSQNQEPLVVTGKVTSKTETQGLPGVNVIIKGTVTGMITDVNGMYRINVPSSDAVLQFSFIGFQSREIPVNGQSVIDVVMEEDVQSIDEVVVTALSIERNKNSLGYSITQVGSEELTSVKESNPINSLAGKVAGLQISNTPSGVDGSSRVVLRGISSLSGSNRPLIVIDGIPVGGDSYGGAGIDGGKDMGDALSDINPDEIENMSVLKGAGAAAAYGSRGANGVILITTKNGAGRKGIGVSVSSSYIMESPLIYPQLQSEYGQGAFGQHPTEMGTTMTNIKGEEPWIWSWGRKMEGQVLPDWLDQPTPYTAQPNPFSTFYNTGSNFMNTVAIDGGNEVSSVRASVSTQNNKGIYPTNDMKKQTINLRGVAKLGKKTSVDGKFTYIHNTVENRPYTAEDVASSGWLLSVLPRDVQLQSVKDNRYDANGLEQWGWDRTLGNIYWEMENKKNNDEKHRLQGLFSVNIDFSEKLDLMVRSGMDFTNRNVKEYAAQGSRVNNAYRGWYNQGFDNSLEWNSDFLLSYKEDLSDDIKLNFSLGGNYRYNNYKAISQGGNTWRVPDFYNISNLENYSTGEYFSEKEVMSLYGLGTLSYLNYLYLDFTYRNDWSSTLPPESNSYGYYSGNLSFLFTEAFNIDNSVLSLGKIRGSYAKVGNDTGPYQTQNYYSINQSVWPYPNGSMSSKLAFADFKPEITTSWEVGANLNLFNNLISVDLAYYHSDSRNQIMDVKLAPSSGFQDIKQNAGEVENRGFEGLISASPVSSKNGLNWDVSLNFSRNKSEVVSLAEGETRKVLANSINSFVTIELRPGEPFGSIYGIDYKRDGNGNKLINDDGTAIAGDYVNLGDINPDLMGGLSNQFSYKNIQLRFLIDFQLGGEYYSHGLTYRSLMGTAVESLKGRDEWYSTHEGMFFGDPIKGVIPKGYVEDGVNINTGQVNTVPLEPMMRAINTIWFNKIVSDYILEATNVRLRELSLGYDLPKSLINKTPLTNVNIALVGRNLFFFYNASKHNDPESGFNAGSYGNAIEATAMPATRSYGFNLTVNF